MNNNFKLSDIKSKKFDADKFIELAEEVAEILEDEAKERREEQLKELDDYSVSRKLSF